MKNFGLKMGAEEIVSKDACLGQSSATLANFEVNPSITVQTCQLGFIDEVVCDVQDFNANVFQLGHGSIKVEVLKVYGAKSGTFLREYTVEEKLEKLQRCCVSVRYPGIQYPTIIHG
jgi:hypothetical protein